jgi:hypothetical protein
MRSQVRLASGAVFLVGVVLLSGCGGGAGKGGDANGRGANGKKPAGDKEQGSAKPALSVKAEELAKDYAVDPAAADKKYKDKILEVEGKIHDQYGKEVGPEPSVVLWGYQEKPATVPQLVQCYFVPSLQEKAAALKKGDTIKLRGRCTGAFAKIFVKMTGCEFAK